MMVATAPSIFFCGFFFACLYIASWISADIDVVHHPAKRFHEIVVSTKQVAEKFLPPAVLLFIFIGFVFNDVTADVVYRIADKIENDFPYVINDEAIHIRGGVEHISLGAFALLPSIETICLEGIDPDVMEDDWANLGNSNLTILVPEDTSDEQLEAVGRKFLSSMIITDAAQVKRGTCSMPEDPMPDIAEMLSAYGI